MMPSYRRRLASGIAWLSLARLLVNLMQVCSTFVLARLLVPADVGLFVFAATISGVLQSVTDMSLGSALVQHRAPTMVHYNTAWTFNALRGVSLALVFAAIAWPAARLHHDPRLFGVMLMLAGGLILSGFDNPRAIMLTKDLVFWQQFLLQVPGKAVSVVVAVAVALAWHSYWSLVLGLLAGQAATLLLSYAVFPYRPRPSLRHGRELFSFSVWLTAGQVMTTLNWNFDQLLVGGYFGSATLGLYAVGSGLAMVATREAIAPVAATLFPAYATLAEDPQRLRAAFRSAQALVVALAVPVGVGLALVADPLVRIAMGPEWRPVVPIIQVLAPTFALQTIGDMVQPLAMARGLTRRLFLRDLQAFVVRVPLVATGMLLFGLPGLLAAGVLSGVALTALQLAIVRSLDIPVGRQVLRNLRSVASAGAMAAGVLFADRHLSLSGAIGEQAVRLVLLIALGIMLYPATHALLWFVSGRPNGPEREAARLLQAVRRRSARHVAPAT